MQVLDFAVHNNHGTLSWEVRFLTLVIFSLESSGSVRKEMACFRFSCSVPESLINFFAFLFLCKYKSSH